VTKESWQSQKVLKANKNSTTPNDIVIIAKGIKNPRNQALFVILYLTAGRISEVVRSLYRKDLSEQEVDFRRVILFRMNNRKHRKQNFKNIPIPYDKEKELLDIIFPWLDDKDLEQCLFPFTKTRGYQIIKKETGWNPHWIRHLRLTNLAVYNDFNDQLLVKFAGWTDSRPSKEYMELKWKDILQKY
jgi:hypothetical protein